MLQLTFYNYKGLKNALMKTLEDGVTIECNFNIDYDTVHPTIKLVLPDKFDYNYCYIPEINKYYFVDAVSIKRNNFYEISLTEDVLQTYSEFIKTLSGTVVQSKTPYYLQSANFPVDSRVQVKQYSFTDKFNHDGNYIMVGV